MIHKISEYISEEQLEKTTSIGIECVEISRNDWNTYETSWDFKKHPLI